MDGLQLSWNAVESKCKEVNCKLEITEPLDKYEK